MNRAASPPQHSALSTLHSRSAPDRLAQRTQSRRERILLARHMVQAMSVAERFDEYWINKCGGGRYEVEMNSWAWADHTDKCIAICIAALRAVGVPDKEIEEVCG